MRKANLRLVIRLTSSSSAPFYRFQVVDFGQSEDHGSASEVGSGLEATDELMVIRVSVHLSLGFCDPFLVVMLTFRI